MVASLGYREQAPRFLEIGLVEPQVNSRCDQENAVIVRGVGAVDGEPRHSGMG